MADASTMDLVTVLQRVDEIEDKHNDPQVLPNVFELRSDRAWLCRQLRTALADTRRVDKAQELYHSADFEYTDANGTRAVVLIDIPSGVGIGPDFRAFLDAAMAATPRETNHE